MTEILFSEQSYVIARANRHECQLMYWLIWKNGLSSKLYTIAI